MTGAGLDGAAAATVVVFAEATVEVETATAPAGETAFVTVLELATDMAASMSASFCSILLSNSDPEKRFIFFQKRNPAAPAEQRTRITTTIIGVLEEVRRGAAIGISGGASMSSVMGIEIGRAHV